MSFLDNLTKKANDAYQTTKEKTVQLTTEFKMKSKINNNNDKIKALYKELGMLVFDSYKSNTHLTEDEINPKCEEINALLEEVAKIKVDILSLKKLKKCVSCDSEIDQGDNFCPKCGAKQPEIKNDEAKVEEASEDAVDIEIEVKEDKKEDEE